MRAVYVVQHVHVSDDGEEEDVKMIGVYSSRQNAQEAVERLQLQPGFCDHLTGFEIVEYELDKDHWVEGFISWKDALGDD